MGEYILFDFDFESCNTKCLCTLKINRILNFGSKGLMFTK